MSPFYLLFPPIVTTRCEQLLLLLLYFFFFFFNDTATPEIYTLPLHDALPIWRYVPAWSARCNSPSSRNTPYFSTASSVTLSTPAAPRLRRTHSHASHRTSLRWIRSYRAWKRRPGCCLAAVPSLRWSRRTLSMGLRPPGLLDRAVSAMPSRLPPSLA